MTFARPMTTVETATNRVKVCGETSYSIHSDASGANFSYNAAWAVITGPVAGVYTLTFDSTVDLTLIDSEASKQIDVYIKATLDDYTSDNREVYTKLEVTIGEITCNCAALGWDAPLTASVTIGSEIMVGASPSAQSLVMPATNYDAKATNAALEKCYLNNNANPCSADGQVTALTWDNGSAVAAKPSWIDWQLGTESNGNS